jgi:hypothetical protein
MKCGAALEARLQQAASWVCGSGFSLGFVADEIGRIVAGLAGQHGASSVRELADRKVAAGDADFVARLGIAIAGEQASSSDHARQCRSVLHYIARVLALAPGRENVIQAVRLFTAAWPDDRRQVRQAASLLAAGQSPADLAVAFEGGASPGAAAQELRACLVHELVLRGTAVTQIPAITRWTGSAHWQRHRLAWLPLELSGLEADRTLPSYHSRGGSYAAPYGPSGQGTQPPGRAALATVAAVRDVTSLPAAAAIGAAVASWAAESNGRIEAKVFGLASPLPAGLVPGTLAVLGLDCLHGLTPDSRFMVAACPPARAWQILFAAASTGGAYNHGLYGAYGRLAAWQSMAGLCGAAADALAAEAESKARACDWFSFNAGTSWFEQVAWDIGLVTIRPGRRRLAILAATDTD